MSQDVDFSKQSTSTATVAVAPTFTASMTRDAPIGALISLLIGFVLLILKDMLFPGLNLNAWMVSALTQIDEEIGMFAGALLLIPTSTDTASSLYILQYVYTAFLSFPSVLGWFVGGFLIGFLRIRKGRDEGNLRGGWDVFWYGLASVEIPFAVFGILFLVLTLNPAFMAAQAYAGGLLLFFLLFFLQPTFWLGLLLSLTGSLLGSVIARKKG